MWTQYLFYWSITSLHHNLYSQFQCKVRVTKAYRNINMTMQRVVLFSSVILLFFTLILVLQVRETFGRFSKELRVFIRLSSVVR